MARASAVRARLPWRRRASAIRARSKASTLSLSGRALSAYNLVIFVGVFVVQWGIGLAVDAFAAAGLATVPAFQAAMAVYLACNAGAYAWFLLRGRRHNVLTTPTP